MPAAEQPGRRQISGEALCLPGAALAATAPGTRGGREAATGRPDLAVPKGRTKALVCTAVVAAEGPAVDTERPAAGAEGPRSVGSSSDRLVEPGSRRCRGRSRGRGADAAWLGPLQVASSTAGAESVVNSQRSEDRVVFGGENVAQVLDMPAAGAKAGAVDVKNMMVEVAGAAGRGVAVADSEDVAELGVVVVVGDQWVLPSKRTKGRGIWGRRFRRQT